VSAFKAWPKIPRLNRNCIATEKIDGTNAAVIIEKLSAEQQLGMAPHAFGDPRPIAVVQTPVGVWHAVRAQSRRRLLLPGKDTDNFGFAAWVQENALDLTAGLGEGYHYGEWWGSGIQRGYGLRDGEQRFSLFNVGRWSDSAGEAHGQPRPNCCGVVPVLATGTSINAVAEGGLGELEAFGSFAAPGFDNPEGVVVYHTSARQSFKVTLEDDRVPKGARLL
jgi:hypothetical protein